MSESKIKINGTTTLICDCEGTAPIDIDALKRVFPNQDIHPATHLCGKQLHLFEHQLQDNEGSLTVACTHKASVFSELADQFENDEHKAELQFTNIREKAAWSKEAKRTGPKIAALLAEASLTPMDTPFVTMESDGSVLIFGTNQVAMDAAKQLSERMDISLILTPGCDVTLPVLFDFPIYNAIPNMLSGYLGNFEAQLSGLVEMSATSRGTPIFRDAPQDGSAECSLILDLRGVTPLISAPEKRDGYFNPDPASPVAVQIGRAHV